MPGPRTPLTYQVLWTFAAVADVQGIRRYIGQFNPQAARTMADRIIAVGNNLTNFPYRGRPVPGTELRESTLAYPYIIRYRIDCNRVLILRVRHGRQRPTNP